MDISDDTRFIQYGILYGMLKRSKKTRHEVKSWLKWTWSTSRPSEIKVQFIAKKNSKVDIFFFFSLKNLKRSLLVCEYREHKISKAYPSYDHIFSSHRAICTSSLQSEYVIRLPNVVFMYSNHLVPCSL